jgi:hypothetical protein
MLDLGNGNATQSAARHNEYRTLVHAEQICNPDGGASSMSALAGAPRKPGSVDMLETKDVKRDQGQNPRSAMVEYPGKEQMNCLGWNHRTSGF